MSLPSPFVSPDWLHENLSDPNVRVVDATWFLPGTDRNALEEYRRRHIPGAVYFDLDLVADTDTDLPHMVASPEKFSRMVGALGIRDSNKIIVYDGPGMFSAARVWWNFKIMGANDCFVLEGGLTRWLQLGLPATDRPSIPAHVPFKARFAEKLVVREAQIQTLLATSDLQGKFQIVDVRPSLRFAGLEPEPRPGVRSGSMPASINLPYSDLVQTDALCPPEVLRERIFAAGIDPSRPIIASCGSGVTAPILCIALASMGIEAMHVYDGSWAQWAAANGNPVIGADGKPV